MCDFEPQQIYENLIFFIDDWFPLALTAKSRGYQRNKYFLLIDVATSEKMFERVEA